MTGLPQLSCIPRLAVNWILQLHFSTDFQVISKTTSSDSTSPSTFFFSPSKCSCVAEFLLSPNYFTWLIAHKFNANLNCQPQNLQTSHVIVKQCISLKILQRIFQYSPSTSSQGICCCNSCYSGFLQSEQVPATSFCNFPSSLQFRISPVFPTQKTSLTWLSMMERNYNLAESVRRAV